MKLNEFVDKNGNKVNTTQSPAVSQPTSSGSFKKRFEKLLAYAQAHKNASVNSTIINSITDNDFSYSEKIRGGYSYYDREITVYIGSQTEAWRLKIYIDNKIDDDLAGQGWPELLKTLRYYITVPVTTTLEYKELLTEWVDNTGKKVSLTSSSSQTASSTSSNKSSTKTNKEKFKELTDYMIAHKSSLVSKAYVVRLDDGGFTYKESWRSSSGQDYILTVLVGYSRFNSSWKLELYMDTSLVREAQGAGLENLLEELERYFHVPKAGTKEYNSLLEWVDSKGNKVSTTSSDDTTEPGIPDQAYRYKRLLAQVDADKLFRKYTVNLLDSRTLDITLGNGVNVKLERQDHFPIYKLTIKGSSMTYDDYEDVLKALIEEGIIGDTDLCESVSSIADDFKAYENLWD